MLKLRRGEVDMSISKNCEKWLPFNYSFICLVYVSAIQNNLWFITRLVRLRFKLDGSHFSNKPIQGQPEMWLSAFLKLHSKAKLKRALRCNVQVHACHSVQPKQQSRNVWHIAPLKRRRFLQKKVICMNKHLVLVLLFPML